MPIENMKDLLLAAKAAEPGTYAVVHGQPGDASVHQAKKELTAIQGSAPVEVDFLHLPAASPAHGAIATLREAAAAGRNVIASGFEFLEAHDFTAFKAAMREISEAGRHAVAVAKTPISAQHFEGTLHGKWDPTAESPMSQIHKLADKLRERVAKHTGPELETPSSAPKP